MQSLQLIDLAFPDALASDGEVLSPESHVFVALMSVEEGPNKAVFLRGFPRPDADGAGMQGVPTVPTDRG